LGSHLFALKIEEKWIEVDQAKLFCRTLGEGKPLIVIHGGAGLSQDYLLPWLTKLAEHHFVIFYDQKCGKFRKLGFNEDRGCGKGWTVPYHCIS